MMLIDTHCHLTYPELAPQVDAVLERARQAGVGRCVTIATSLADARAAIALARSRAAVSLAAAIHPHEAGAATDADLAAIADLHHGRWTEIPAGREPKAVGETGLDFHYDFAPRARQEEVLRFHLELACDVAKPVIIHARESEARVCEILAGYPALRGRVVFHCFSGDEALARRVLDQGFWLSFTGVVTFRNADAVRAAARLCPADRILVETDAPYLTPEPIRKLRPNEPAHVAHTARFLAELRGVSQAEFAATTTHNAERFFGLATEKSA